jgi:DNA repair exonuclease SbcCD ATPase subunit
MAKREIERLRKAGKHGEEQAAELQLRIRALEEEAAKARAKALDDSSRSVDTGSNGKVFTPPLTPSDDTGREPPMSLTAAAQPTADPQSDKAQELQHRIEALQKQYEATVAELDHVNAKYKDTLQEVQDLSQQVEEAQLLRSEGGDTLPSPSPSPRSSPVQPPTTSSSSAGPADDEEDEVAGLPPLPSNSLSSGAGRTPRSRRSLPIASNGRLSFLGSRVASGGPYSTAHLRSASLSQELSSAQGLRSSLPPSPRATSPGRMMSHQRSYESLEKEVKQLQNALESRDEEINALETAIGKMGGTTPMSDDWSQEIIADGATTPSKPSRLPSPTLSPMTMEAFNSLKTELEGDAQAGSATHDHSVRLAELMRSMAKKESAHKEHVEDLESQLANLRKAHDELTTLSRDQVVNMSSEIEMLRNSLMKGDGGAPTDEATQKRLAEMQSALTSKEEELAEARREAQECIEKATAKLTAEHEASRRALEEEHAEAIRRLQEEHAAVLRRMLEQREELFTRKMQEYEAALETQARDHAELSKRKESDHAAALAAVQGEMATSLKRKDDEADEADKRFAIERESLLTSGQQDVSETIAKLNAEHSRVLQRRQVDFDEACEKLKADHSAVLGSREANHAAAIARLREEHDAAFTQTIEDHSATAQDLRNERDEAVKNARTEHEAALARLKEDHSNALSAATTDFEGRLAEARESHAREREQLESSHADASKTADAQHGAALALALGQLDRKKTQEAERAVAELRDEHAAAIQKLADSHEASVRSLGDEHDAEIRRREAEHQAALAAKSEEHEKALSDVVRWLCVSFDAPLTCHWCSAMASLRNASKRCATSIPPPYET